MKKYTEGELLAEALRGALIAKRDLERARGSRNRRGSTQRLAKGAAPQPAPPSIYNLQPETAALMTAIKAIHRKGGDFPHGSPFGVLKV